MQVPGLSVVIITKNEEKRVARCLQSIQWADEIIVFDSGSTDNTVAICRKWTPHVYETDWPGYGVQKGRALAKTTGDWVLSIDADEEVTEGLRQEIQDCVAQNRAGHAGYKIPRLNKVCGMYLRHGGWWPDYHPRLACRDKLVFNAKRVHEGMVIDGSVGFLTQPMLHDGAADLDDMLHKSHLYSTLAAEERFANGRSCGLSIAVARGMWTFIRLYLLKGGFLDGRMGFVISVLAAQGTYYRYVMLWLLNNKNPVVSVARCNDVPNERLR